MCELRPLRHPPKSSLLRSLLAAMLWLCFLEAAPAERFPDEQWEVAASPEKVGWSAKQLHEAKAYSETIDTAALVIVHGGLVVDQWGEIDRPFNCHSIRKSLLSALYGIHVDEGNIDLDHTLEQLGIDDNEPSLTETERTATVRKLLQSRSGVYHPALYETARMRNRRPERGSHQPGTFWYYNNWDFNALGTIFQNQTAHGIFEELERRLAQPLGMQDFDRLRHTRFVTGGESVHPAYPLRLSARDLARFGLLYARGGRWNDSQIVPQSWVTKSTTSYSDAGGPGGYGYMWWVAQDGRHYPGVELPDGAFTGRGNRGHVLLVVPEWDLVVVHRVNTFRRGNEVSSRQLGRLLQLILAAMPEEARVGIEEEGQGKAREHSANRPSNNSRHSQRADEAASFRFDLLLKNGRIMDGSGNPWFLGDVAIRDGKIAALGRLDPEEAAHTIDVSHKVIAPGFIDMHSHAEGGLMSSNARRRAAPNLVTQGITTVVVNQDGFGPSSLDEQLESFHQQGVGPHVILLIGHGGIRRAAMNDDYRRGATEEEIEHMRRLLREALELGAFGMSAGLEYVPGRWATADEMKELVGELAKFDGVYMLHERSSGTTPMWYLPSRDGPETTSMMDNIEELIEVGRATGAKVVATHIKARGKDFWGSSEQMIQRINEARNQGVRIYADQYPYNTSGSDGRVVLLPDWLAQRVGTRDGEELSPAEMLEEALQDERIAADLRQDIRHEITRRGGPQQIIIMDHPDEQLVGRSLEEAAQEYDISPLEMVIRLQREGRRDLPGGARLRAFSMSECDVEAFMQQPWTATASDAGIALPTDTRQVHPRFYGSFPRKIRHYALQRRVITVEHAIRSATTLPAQILGLPDRGYVRQGFHADLVVIDLERVRDKATAAEPHQYSKGIDYVLVGGTFVVEAGEVTGELPGQVILRSQP